MTSTSAAGRTLHAELRSGSLLQRAAAVHTFHSGVVSGGALADPRSPSFDNRPASQPCKSRDFYLASLELKAIMDRSSPSPRHSPGSPPRCVANPIIRTQTFRDCEATFAPGTGSARTSTDAGAPPADDPMASPMASPFAWPTPFGTSPAQRKGPSAPPSPPWRAMRHMSLPVDIPSCRHAVQPL